MINLMERRPPVIICGMHRSGTTMITRILDQLGLYVGKSLDDNHEDLFFSNLNNWLLRQSSAEWDRPQGFKDVFLDIKVKEQIVERLKSYIKSPRIFWYLGLNCFIKYPQFLQKLDWGWKDPRNTFTLPIWIELFPDAKIVNIYRHGVDVAKSLNVRANKYLNLEKKHPNHGWNKRRLYNVSNSIRCLTFDGAFDIWKEYMMEQEKYCFYSKSQIINVKYEDFLNDSVKYLNEITTFLEMNVSENDLISASSIVDKSAAYRYKNNSVLTEYAEKNRSFLSRYGY